MKKVQIALLKLLADTYPAWAKSLNRDKAYKVSVCKSYQRLIEECHTIDHIEQLEQWLNSPSNVQFKKWPPQPLELKEALKMVSRTVREQVHPQSSGKMSDPDFLIPRLMLVCKFSKNPDKYFTEKNMHLKECVFKAIDFFVHHKPLFLSATKLDTLFRAECEKNGQLEKQQIWNRLLEKWDLLKERIGEIDRQSLINFFKETRWNEDIFQIVANAGETAYTEAHV